LATDRQTNRQTNKWTAPMHKADLAVASGGLILIIRKLITRAMWQCRRIWPNLKRGDTKHSLTLLDKIIAKIKGAFFLPHSVVFPHQTEWKYSDGYPLMGASNARGYKNITIFDQYLDLSRNWCKIQP